MKLSKINLAILLSLSSHHVLANSVIDDTKELDKLSELEQQFIQFYDIELPDSIGFEPRPIEVEIPTEAEDFSYIFSGTTYALTTLQYYLGTFYPALQGSFIVSTPGTYVTYFALDYTGRVIGGILRVAGEDKAAAYFPQNPHTSHAPKATFFGQDLELGKYEWVEELIDVPNQAFLGTAYTFSEFGYKLTNDPIGLVEEYIEMHEDMGVDLTCSYTGYCNQSSSTTETTQQKGPDYYVQMGHNSDLIHHKNGAQTEQFEENPGLPSQDIRYHSIYTSGSKNMADLPFDSSDAYINFGRVNSGGDDFLFMKHNPWGNSFAGEGDDLIVNFKSGKYYGEEGNDIIIGKTLFNRASAFGGQGNDFISRLDYANGGSGVDTLLGVKHGLGSSGSDLLVGTSQNDTLEGGSDNDMIEAGHGIDTIYGGSGDDVMRLDATRGAKTELVVGGEGEDALEIQISQMMATTTVTKRNNGGFKVHSQNLRILDFDEIESLHWRQVMPSSDHDRTANPLDDGSIPTHFVIDARTMSFAQAFTGQGGLVTFLSGSGNDMLFGGALSNTLKGGKGDDVIRGGQSDDDLYGGLGNDLFIASLGNDRYHGGAGVDTLTYESISTGQTVKLAQISDRIENLLGTEFEDELHGNALKNFIAGGVGSDKLYGHAGRDKLVGDEGDDTLNGGRGNDILIGGAGHDTFVMSQGDDIIEDYSQDDSIDLTELNAPLSDVAIEKGETHTLVYFEDASITLQNYRDEVQFIESKKHQ